MVAIPPLKKMQQALSAAKERSQRSRTLREEAFREFLGRFYATDDNISRPMNLVNRACKVIQAHLAARNPRFDVQCDDPMLKGESVTLGMLITESAQELNFTRLDRLFILDALLGPRAVARMGTRTGDEIQTIAGRSYAVGEWYIRRISPDDHHVDPSARDPEELAWEGDSYRVRKESLRRILPQNVVDSLPVLPIRPGGESGQAGRVEEIGADTAGSDRFGLIEMVELTDVFLYDPSGNGETLKLTMLAEGGNDYLRQTVFEGPRKGPYAWFEFTPIPDNIDALPPVAEHREQSENVNKVLTKLIEQIARSRRIPVYGDNMRDDEIEAIETNRDGEGVRCQDPTQAKILDMTVISPELAPLAQMLLRFANIQANNPDMMGGTGSDASTATEFQGLSLGANTMTEFMVDAHDSFWSEIGQNRMWEAIHDPFVQFGATRRAPGGESIPVYYSAEARRGQYEQFRCEVVQRSTVRMDDAARANNLVKLAGLVPAYVQTEMITRGAFSAFGTIREIAKRMGEHDLDVMIRDPGLLQQLAQRFAFTPQLSRGVPMGGMSGMGGGTGGPPGMGGINGPMQGAAPGMGRPQSNRRPPARKPAPQAVSAAPTGGGY